MSTNKRECRLCGRKFKPKGNEQYCSAKHRHDAEVQRLERRRTEDPEAKRKYDRAWIARRRRDPKFREAERARRRRRYAAEHPQQRGEDCR